MLFAWLYPYTRNQIVNKIYHSVLVAQSIKINFDNFWLLFLSFWALIVLSHVSPDFNKIFISQNREFCAYFYDKLTQSIWRNEKIFLYKKKWGKTFVIDKRMRKVFFSFSPELLLHKTNNIAGENELINLVWSNSLLCVGIFEISEKLKIFFKWLKRWELTSSIWLNYSLSRDEKRKT